MVGKAELDAPAIDTSSPCSSASSLLHIRVFARRPPRCFRLCSLLPSSLMYNCLFQYAPRVPYPLPNTTAGGQERKALHHLRHIRGGGVLIGGG